MKRCKCRPSLPASFSPSAPPGLLRGPIVSTGAGRFSARRLQLVRLSRDQAGRVVELLDEASARMQRRHALGEELKRGHPRGARPPRARGRVVGRGHRHALPARRPPPDVARRRLHHTLAAGAQGDRRPPQRLEDQDQRGLGATGSSVSSQRRGARRRRAAAGGCKATAQAY